MTKTGGAAPDIQELKRLAEETRDDRWVFAPPHTILALIEENERMKKTISSCQWYHPEDDTSSDRCVSDPSEILEDAEPGEVVAITRSGVVEIKYYAMLPPAEDADSDDDFYVETSTPEEAERLVANELARRTALEGVKK